MCSRKFPLKPVINSSVCVCVWGGGKWMHSMYAEEFQHFKHLYFKCFTVPEAATRLSACKKALKYVMLACEGPQGSLTHPSSFHFTFAPAGC